MLYGRAALSDVELLALLLGGGRAVARAARVLDTFENLLGVERACPHELRAVPGVGDAGAGAIAAAFELGRRARLLELPYADAVRHPEDVADFLRATLADATQEMFVVLGLDARHRVRLVRTVAMGTISQVDVHPREVFRPLVRAGMCAAIVVHNHPSGDATPSGEDVMLTERLRHVGDILGIVLLDHLVVTRKSIVSMARLGRLREAPEG